MLLKNLRYRTHKNTKLSENDKPVQSGLAVTPAQMAKLTQQGIPISPANLGLVYQEGVSKLDFETPMEYTRGVDIADMWNKREDMRVKLRSPEFRNVLEKEV